MGDKFMFLKYDTQNPKNRKHAPFILEQIINWLYTGELKVLHNVEEDEEGVLFENSEYLEEINHFANKFGGYILKKLTEELKDHIDADIKQMNEDKQMNSKDKTKMTFDNLSFNERIRFILGHNHENTKNVDVLDVLQRFQANERRSNREFDVSYF